MTEEEIKNLKTGDKFTVEYTTKAIYKDGVQIAFANGTSDGTCTFDDELLQNATLVKPVPKFEVGDTVRIIPDPMTGTVYGNGNSYAEWAEQDARILKEKLRATEMQVALSSGHIIDVNIHCLELVKKAVKDKYFVKSEGSGNAVVTIWDRETNNEVICYWKTHPNAKAAAEAACDRLNAEWRKQEEGAK